MDESIRRTDEHGGNDLRMDSSRSRILGIDLPDTKDVQVLEDAVHSNADCLVTCNLKDFPKLRLERLTVVSIDPGAVLHLLIKQNPAIFREAVAAVRLSKRRPA